MPIVAALAISFPVFVGAYFDALPSGIKASLGAMIILNLPLVGSLPYRLVTVMAWGFAMAMSFALGLIAQQLPWLRLPVFVLMAFGGRAAGALLSSAATCRVVCDDGRRDSTVYADTTGAGASGDGAGGIGQRGVDVIGGAVYAVFVDDAYGRACACLSL
ncbi:hypothetical protein ACTXIZ_05140 [Psychrobacter celer]|uniref:hypothetical protein n=1 Tax=Psychrobacter celer TaxID=306572 RepID=UPI003FD2FD2B